MGSVISVHCGSSFRETQDFYEFVMWCVVCAMWSPLRKTPLQKNCSPYSLTIGECDQCTLWILFERDPPILINILCVVLAILRPISKTSLQTCLAPEKIPLQKKSAPEKNLSLKFF